MPTSLRFLRTLSLSGTIRLRLRTESYGHRLQIRAPCASNCDLRQYKGFKDLVNDYPARGGDSRGTIEEYLSINDYVKTRRNRYPDTVDNPRVSNCIKGNRQTIEEALELHLGFYLVENEEDRLVAGSDLDLHMLNGFIKNPERTSLNPAVTDASWHFTMRAKHSYDPELMRKIRCKNRAVTDRLKEAIGSDYIGPYWNYFDGASDKSDYYGDAYDKVSAIKEKYDPDNLFKKIKGVKVNDDNEIACLREFCDGYTGYWEK